MTQISHFFTTEIDTLKGTNPPRSKFCPAGSWDQTNEMQAWNWRFRFKMCDLKKKKNLKQERLPAFFWTIHVFGSLKCMGFFRGLYQTGCSSMTSLTPNTWHVLVPQVQRSKRTRWAIGCLTIGSGVFCFFAISGCWTKWEGWGFYPLYLLDKMRLLCLLDKMGMLVISLLTRVFDNGREKVLSTSHWEQDQKELR